VTRSTGALARRYARALFDVADAKGGAAALELRGEGAQLDAHAGLRQPTLGAEAKRKIVIALAQAAQASPIVLKLVELLASRDRLGLLGDVAAAYAGLANARKGVVAAEVVSALPLAPAQRQALEQALAGKAESVELTSQVEPGIVGGLVIRMAGRTYDGSVRTRLAALRRRLAASS